MRCEPPESAATPRHPLVSMTLDARHARVKLSSACRLRAHADGTDIPTLLTAVLTLMPLDETVPPALLMGMVRPVGADIRVLGLTRLTTSTLERLRPPCSDPHIDGGAQGRGLEDAHLGDIQAGALRCLRRWAASARAAERAVPAAPLQIVNAAEGKSVPFEEVERFAFYERAKKAFAVVSTGAWTTSDPESGDARPLGHGAPALAFAPSLPPRVPMIGELALYGNLILKKVRQSGRGARTSNLTSAVSADRAHRL